MSLYSVGNCTICVDYVKKECFFNQACCFLKVKSTAAPIASQHSKIDCQLRTPGTFRSNWLHKENSTHIKTTWSRIKSSYECHRSLSSSRLCCSNPRPMHAPSESPKRGTKVLSNQVPFALQDSPMLVPQPDKDTGLFQGDIRFTPEQMLQMKISTVRFIKTLISLLKNVNKGNTVECLKLHCFYTLTLRLVCA